MTEIDSGALDLSSDTDGNAFHMNYFSPCFKQLIHNLLTNPDVL